MHRVQILPGAFIMSYSLFKRRKRKHSPIAAMVLPEKHYNKFDYGLSNYVSDQLREFLQEKTAAQIERAMNVLAGNARFATGVYSRAEHIENAVKNGEPFSGRTPEELDYYEHLLATVDNHPEQSDDDQSNDGEQRD